MSASPLKADKPADVSLSPLCAISGPLVSVLPQHPRNRTQNQRLGLKREVPDLDDLLHAARQHEQPSLVLIPIWRTRKMSDQNGAMGGKHGDLASSCHRTD